MFCHPNLIQRDLYRCRLGGSRSFKEARASNDLSNYVYKSFLLECPGL